MQDFISILKELTAGPGRMQQVGRTAPGGTDPTGIRAAAADLRAVRSYKRAQELQARTRERLAKAEACLERAQALLRAKEE